jgi:hypothetical protein
VFLYAERSSQIYFVIDGQQRLKSVFYFFEGFFGEEDEGRRRVFRLSGLSDKSRFQGKSFDELRDEDKRRLKNSVLRAFVVQQLDPQDDTSIYHIFERLNTGGTLLTNQEIRNCVYHGSFIRFLDRINTDECWRKILGKNVPDTRKKDIELLIRFFAMRDISGYDKPMKDFLSRFMKKNRAASAEALAATESNFKNTCKAILDSLGERPFHVRAGLNAAVFDAVAVAFSKHLDNLPSDIEQRYERLLENEQFDSATRQATTDADTVRQRFATAEQVLFA